VGQGAADDRGRIVNGTQIQEWINANGPPEKMLWAGAFAQQVCFLRDDVSRALGMSYEDVKGPRVSVIGTHKSKSILLPVVRYVINHAALVVRGNFHDFKVSVDSDKALRIDHRGLFTPTEEHADCYCEGFPEGLVFGSYASSLRRFTVSLGSEYALWTFAREVRLALLA
jgi:hypothetical protein